jgi:hypothetical protein
VSNAILIVVVDVEMCWGRYLPAFAAAREGQEVEPYRALLAEAWRRAPISKPRVPPRATGKLTDLWVSRTDLSEQLEVLRSPSAPTERRRWAVLQSAGMVFELLCIAWQAVPAPVFDVTGAGYGRLLLQRPDDVSLVLEGPIRGETFEYGDGHHATRFAIEEVRLLVEAVDGLPAPRSLGARGVREREHLMRLLAVGSADPTLALVHMVV